MSHTKLAPLLLSTWIRWLIDLAAYQGPRRILRIDEESCREYHIASEPARQGQKSSKLEGAVPYNQRVSGNDGKSDGFHSRLARTLDTYVWIHVRCIYSDSSVLAKHILVAAQKDKAIELRERLDVFAKNFDRALLIEIRLEQGLVSIPILIVPLVWSMMAAAMADSVANLQGMSPAIFVELV